jgi:hypothetical protein
MTEGELILNRLMRIEMMLERMTGFAPPAEVPGYGGKSYAQSVAEANERRRMLDERAAKRAALKIEKGRASC